jgi:hypothetical protein
MLKRKALFTLFIALLAVALAARPASAAKRYSAERYDVVIAVQPDGGLVVTETVIFRFEGGPFTYVFRDLEYANLDSIGQAQATLDGLALPPGTGPGQVEIETGRPLKVTWHFAPTSDATHTFGLTYRVLGAVRQAADGDTLIWRAIPEEHDYPIDSSTIRVEYAPGVAPQGAPTLTGSDAVSVDTAGQAATLTTGPIDDDQPVDVTVRFPAGSLIGAPPAWQTAQAQRAELARQALPVGFAAAAITGLLGLAGLMIVQRSFHRDPVADTGQRYVTPPREIPPALAGRLAGASTSFLGTLFDLGRRGVLAIEERRGTFGRRTFELVRQTSREPLRPHEQAFVDALFRKARDGRVPMDRIAALASHSPFVQALDQELTTAGWRDAERSARRGRLTAATVLGLVLGLVVFIVGLVLLNGAFGLSTWAAIAAGIAGGVGLALVGLSLLGLIATGLASPLTAEGAWQAAAWKGFAAHLHDVTRGREAAMAPDVFDRYLPYAASLGLATRWAKHFQNQGLAAVPAWFHGLSQAADDGSYVAIMAAVTSADSSASAAASAGAAGASGGGASGAG